MAAGFIIALVTSGAVWMIGSDRVQAVAGYDGAFAGWFGIFNRRLGTPVRVNVMSGIAATIFMIVGIQSEQGQHGRDIRRRPVHSHIDDADLLHRDFPSGDQAAVFSPGCAATIPPPWRHAGGVDRGRHLHRLHSALIIHSGVPGRNRESSRGGLQLPEILGISRLRFEAFTLGTLAVIIAFAVVGYWLGRPVREQEGDVALGAPAPP